MKTYNINPKIRSFIQSKWFTYTVFGIAGLIAIAILLLKDSGNDVPVTKPNVSDTITIPRDTSADKQPKVTLQRSTFDFFGEQIEVFEKEGSRNFHYPYIIINEYEYINKGRDSSTTNRQSRIFNVETQTEVSLTEKEKHSTILDYDGEHILSYGDADIGSSYVVFDKIDINFECSKGSIVSDTEILCMQKDGEDTSFLQVIHIPEMKAEIIFDTDTEIDSFLFDEDRQILLIATSTIGYRGVDLPEAMHLHLLRKTSDGYIEEAKIETDVALYPMWIFIHPNPDGPDYIYIGTCWFYYTDEGETTLRSHTYSVSYENNELRTHEIADDKLIFFRE